MRAKTKQVEQESTVVDEEKELLLGSDAIMSKLGNPDISELSFVEVEGGLYIDSGEKTVYTEVEEGETVAEEVEDIPDGGNEILVSSPEEKINEGTDSNTTLAGD